MKISILTQNVMCWECPGGEFDKRRERVRRLIRRLDPDLLGFQEVTKLWKSYFDEDLADYGSVFRYRGETDYEAVPLYYRKDRFDLEKSGWFWLSDTPDRESWGPGAGCRRITVWAILRERESGARLAFVNTHFDHVSTEARVLGVKVIRDFIEKNACGLPVILTGDLNDLSYSEPIELLREFLTDSRLVAPKTGETNTHASRFGCPADASIDYIFTRGADVLTYSVEREADGPYPQSDHYGVFVTATV